MRKKKRALVIDCGTFITVDIVDREQGFVGGTIEIDEKYRTKNYIDVDQKFYEPVIDGMEKVVTGGTATNARIKDIRICGKTGTSQNPHGKDHSVFFAFAPRENPKIAIAVYVEHGVWGNRYASIIASLMTEKYLKGEIDSGIKELASP